MKSWNYKKTEIDEAGLKTTVSITTQNENVIRKLLGELNEASNPKKDYMNAEVKDVKKKKQKLVLPAPQKKDSPKKENPKKLKAYHYERSKKDKEFYPSIIIYSCNKKDADKLAEIYIKVNHFKLTYLKTTSISAAKAKPPKHLNEHNYFELQKIAILKNIN